MLVCLTSKLQRIEKVGSEMFPQLVIRQMYKCIETGPELPEARFMNHSWG